MKKKNTRTNKKEIATIVNLILDKSGSMTNCKEGTIKGFNEYLNGLKQKKGDVRMSLTLFDTTAFNEINIEKRYVNTPVKEIKPLSNDSYIPGGGTPLYDAAVDSIEESYNKIKNMDSKPVVITVIITDGEENSSVRHNLTCLKDLQTKLTKEGNWTFVFLGANQDSYKTASSFNMSRGNIGDFQGSNAGWTLAFNGLSRGTDVLMASALSGKGLSTCDFLAGIETEVKENVT